MIKSKREYLVESLIAAPSLSSALYILYWNLDLNAKAWRELGDLRLLVQKEEARINEQEKVDDKRIREIRMSNTAQNGKGDSRRQRQVDQEKFDANWDAIFGKVFKEEIKQVDENNQEDKD